MITSHLDNLRRAKEQFVHRRLIVSGKVIPWYCWLKDRVTNKDGLTQLKIDPQAANLCIAGQSADVDDIFKTETTCILIEAVLRKALRVKE